MLPKKFVDWDRINVTLELQNKIDLWWKNQDIETVDNIPFNRGVICCKDAIQFKETKEVYDIYLAFELQETHIDMYEIYGMDGTIAKKWELLYEGTVIDNIRNFLITFNKDLEMHKPRMLELSMIFLAMVNFIVYYKEDVKVLRKQTSIRTPPKKKKGSSKSVIYIPTKTYTLLNIPTTDNVRKPIERKTEAWEVRGHPRHYKDGRVVWIKPYVKGDKSKTKPKTYQVVDFKDKGE